MQRVPPPPTLRRRLENGLTVLLLPRPLSPVASVWVWHRVGSKNEPKGSTGAAHWLEHMLFKGSPHYPAGAIDRALVGVGGILNAFTDNDFTAYFSTVPREHLDIPLSIERDRLVGATLPEREIDRERSVVLSEREGNENHPGFRSEEELYALAFRRHPYRWDALGYAEDIRAMDREHLSSFYRRFYGPENACLVVSGGFDPRETFPHVRRLFGRIHHPVEDPLVKDREPAQTGRRISTLRGPGSTPLLRLGWRSAAASEPEAASLLLLDLLLGGDNSFFPTGGSRFEEREHPTARLYQALVDEGLATRATSQYAPRVHPGLFTVYAQCAPGVELPRLEERLLQEIERTSRDPVPPEELRHLKERLVRGSVLAREGATGSAFRVGFFWALGDLGLEDRLFRRALRVTPTELQQSAQRLFTDRSLNTVHYEVEPPRAGPGTGGKRE